MHTLSNNLPITLYIDLLKRSITNYIYLGENDSFEQYNCLDHYHKKSHEWKPVSIPMTVLSKGQLDLVEKCVLDLEDRCITGDYIEAGVWRGGSIIFLSALLLAYDIKDRKVYAADSFCGIPKNTVFRHDPVDQWTDRWEANQNEVVKNIERFSIPKDAVEFVSGQFSESLKSLSDCKFSFIRIDCDAHDSVLTSLEFLYPLLQPGGIVVIDDWHLVGCRFAVDNYRATHDIHDKIYEESGNGYWVKSGD